MKNKYACAIAGGICALLLIAVFLNCNYIGDTAEMLIKGIDGAEGDINKLNEIRDQWEERRKILNLSHSEPELDQISLLIDELIIHAQNHEEAEYEKTTARLKRAVENIKEIESFSLKNIF